VTEERKPESQIGDELESLGRQIATAVRSLWESEDAQKLRQEIREGFVVLADEVDTALKSAQDSEAAHEFRGQVQDAVDKARASDVTQQVEQGLASGLQQLNQELAKLIASLEKSGAGTGAEKADTAETPSQPGGDEQA
jgi:hypothetical protein